MTDMTVSQVAIACGVTERTVRRWLRDGRLPALRVGGRIRIPEHALREMAAPYGSGLEPAAPRTQALETWPGIDPARAGEARLQRAARAERMLANVRALATPTDEDSVALVRAGRDEQDDRWDPA